MHSNKYTLGFMTIVAVILGSFLSIAAGSLKEIQELNVENDSKKNILSCLGFKEDPKSPWGPDEIQNKFNGDSRIIEPNKIIFINSFAC